MIAIIKYNAGNIRSVQNALNRLGVSSVITDDPETIKAAEKVIFPGVGEAGSAMGYLRERDLDNVIRELKQPVLGICLGLQLMCASSEEGSTSCLGIFPNKVVRFQGDAIIPHMGWNALDVKGGDLLNGICSTDDVYFVHSYYAETGEFTTGIGNYINPFSAVLERDNFYATQFHPEKSAGIGERILQNFLDL
jgi:glutamine amidotransferase